MSEMQSGREKAGGSPLHEIALSDQTKRKTSESPLVIRHKFGAVGNSKVRTCTPRHTRPVT
jgi:hypothetical protein